MRMSAKAFHKFPAGVTYVHMYTAVIFQWAYFLYVVILYNYECPGDVFYVIFISLYLAIL